MNFIKTDIDEVFLVAPTILSDSRGFFTRTFCKNEFLKIGFNKQFVQFNHSFNERKGTVRGMHFQLPPFSETKLIRCIQGSIYDVVVDLRKNSSTFLQHFAVELNSKNLLSLLIPEGFAHGFQTLEDNTVVIYHHTAFYTSQAEAGIRFDDDSIKIKWPLPVSLISEKDKNYSIIKNNFTGI